MKKYLLNIFLFCLSIVAGKAQCTLGISIATVTNINCNGGTGSITANAATGGTTIPIITTIAGNGYYSYSGDGGAASLAELHSPQGVTLDNFGNIYIADYFNYVIRKINTSGVISKAAGNGVEGYSGDGGAATLAELRKPAGVAVDGYGNIYIADDTNARIRKVNTSGIISTIVGNGISGYSGDGGSATAAELRFPQGVTVDDSGNLYIADSFGQSIRKVNTAGIISTVAGGLNSGYNGDGIAATAAELSYPSGVLVDYSGSIYIADFGNDRIRKVNSSGIISTVAGNGVGSYSGDGGAATSAELAAPVGIAMDISGDIYIAEWSQRIRKVNTSGTISTVAGDGTMGYNGDGIAATTAELFNPYSVAVDSSGNIYIADYSNSRIRKVTNSYFYSWSPSGGTDLIAANLSAGTYTITVTDSNGCTATASAIIAQPDMLYISATSTANVTCNGSTDGSALSNVSGGTSPYNYQWSDANSQTTISATGLSAGTYTVTAIDGNGCSETTGITITQPMAISVVADSSDDHGTCNGSAFAMVNGGSPPYNYLWSGGLTSDTITNQCLGDYCCTITDAHGCIDSVCTTIESATGTSEVKGESEKVKVYPNPNNGLFTIALSSHAELVSASQPTVKIYNLLGQQVYVETLKPVRPIHPGGQVQGDNLIDLSDKPNGIYFYRVLKEDGSLIGEGKVIIDR